MGAGGRIQVSWSPVANATRYRVYRGSAPGAQDRYFDTTAPAFADTGAMAGVADTGASIKGTLWTVKNLFELKLGLRVRVHGNLMENCWKESQAGYAVLFTPRNQDGTSAWVYVREVEFSGNLVRHAGSGVQIEGYDTNATSAQTRGITIANNIFDDIDSVRWGGSGRWIQVGNAPSDLTVDHNTVVHTGQALYVYGGSYGAEMQVANLRFTNNLLKHNAYGIMGDGRGYGNDTLNAYFPGGVVARNTFAGGAPSRYPSGNEFPSITTWQAQFVDFGTSEFGLIDASPYRGSGTDAFDLGAPVAQVQADALAARNGRSGPPPPVAITTATLPDGQTGALYAVTLEATGGNGTYAWTLIDGALPPGVSLGATGAMGGTPTRPGRFALTLRANDASDPANTASRAFEMTIASTPPVVSLVSPANGATIVGNDIDVVASASDADGTVTRVDFFSNGTALGSASVAPWSLHWPNVAPGPYRVTAVATDDSGLAATSAAVDVTVTLTGPPRPPLTINGVTPDRTATTAAQPVTWTVTAAGGEAPCTYQFWVYDGAQWRLGQDWSSSATWLWTPFRSGTYVFQVWARSAGSVASFDTFHSFGPYTVTDPAPLRARALTADRAARMPARTPITWTALATGGTGPYTYQFWVWNGTMWGIGQDWSASSAWTWIPDSPGTFMFQVWIRNAGSTASYDAYRSAGPYAVGNPSSLRVTDMTGDRRFPVPQATPVTWTASAAGGSGPYTYKFYVYDGVSWSVGQDWSASPRWTWIPTAPGTYLFQVWARNAGSEASYDAYRSAAPTTVTGAAPLAVTAVSATSEIPLATGVPARVTAAAVGGSGPYTYQFWVFDGASWTVAQSWTASDRCAWTPTRRGTYSMQVWVRNAGSTRPWDAYGSLATIAVGP